MTRLRSGASISTLARLAGLLALLALLGASACSSDDESTASDGSESDTALEAVEADPADSGADGQTDGSADDGERDNGTDGAGGGSDLDTYCAYVGEVLASSEFNLDDLFLLTPEQLEQRFRTNADITTQGLAASTDEIGPWVNIIDEAVQGSLAIGIEANWDIVAMSENPAFFDPTTLNSLSIASQEIDFYNTEQCNLPTNLSGTNADAVAEAQEQSLAPLAESDSDPESESESESGEDLDGEDLEGDDDLDESGRSLDDAEPIAASDATSTGSAVAGSVGVSTDLPGGDGNAVIEWFLAQMGLPRAAFPEQAWNCMANEIDLTYPEGIEPGPFDPELQALVTTSISECGLG